MAGSTPIYGFPYPESSDLVANYPALGEQLAEDIESTISGLPAAGMSLVSPTSIANSGGSASASGGAVTFTGVSSVSLNGVFTSAYDNYAILFSNLTITNSGYLYFRLRATGSDNTTSNYRYAQVNGSSTGSLSAGGNSGDSKAVVAYLTGGGYNSLNNFQISSPAITSHTSYSTTSMETGTTVYSTATSGAFNATTQFDGITIYPAAGSTTGTVRVYGYKNS